MISKIWRWFKKLWAGLFGYYRGKNGNEPWEWETNSPSTSLESESNRSSNSIKDQDLAFLFHQLLEGVVNGWQENRIEQFFQKLEPRITIEIWLEWLQKYRNQILSSSAPNYQLAARMIILGEMTASLPFVRPVGDLAYQIGEELLKSNNNNQNDNLLVESLRSHLPPRNKSHQLNDNVINDQINENSRDSEVTTPSSLGAILYSLQQDPEYAAETARTLGLETNDPSIIMEHLVKNSESHPPDSPTKTGIEILETEIQTEIETEDSGILYHPDWLDNWFNTGLQKAQLGDLEGAIASWDQILAVDTRISQAWHNRGSALAYLDRFEEAVESFDHAISLNVNDYQSWNDRGNVLYNLKRWQEAIISWDRVIGIQPSHHQAWYNRGLALEKLKLWQEAFDSYQQCLQIEQNFNQAQNRMQKLITRKLVEV